MESNDLLRPEQYGFRKNLSCEIALNSIHDRWIDGGSDVVAILLDLSKAFDTLCHSILHPQT